MSRYTVFMSLLTVAVACAGASAQMQMIFLDDFETDPFAGPTPRWPTASGCTPMAWDTGKNVVPTGSGHSIYADLSLDRVYRNLNVTPEPNGVRGTWWIYDDSMTRAYGQLLAYTGAGFGLGDNEQLYAAGKYNSTTMPGDLVWLSTKYQGRVLYPSSTMGWFNLSAPGSPNRSAGWHQFDIEVTSDGMARFYVDGVLSRTITGATVKTIDSVTLGFGTTSSSNGNAWYDGVVVSRIDNVLSLNMSTPLYRQPGQAVIVKMDVSNLTQKVNGCQALIGYSSTYFPTAGVVSPGGGGVWEELIYEQWNALAGELDTAIGVKLGATPDGGTQADGTVAYVALTAGTTNGYTKLDFRPDGTGGYATMLSDLSAQPVWPYKRGSQTVCIDGTPPGAVTIVATPPGWTNAGIVRLTFSAWDPLSGVDHYEISIDGGGYSTRISPYDVDVSAMSDGTHTATVKAIDRAGNFATAATNFYLDKTAPTGVTIAAAPPSWTSGNTVTLTFSGTDATSGIDHYEVSIDSGAYTTRTSPYALDVSSMSDGTHTATVKAVDKAGNFATATTNFYLDKAAPTGVMIAATPPGWTNAPTVTLTFSATDATSGIDHYEISIDSGPYTTQTSPYGLDVSAMSDGTHTATVKAIDRAGNFATASTNFYLDKTKPVISIDSAKQGGVELLTELGSTTNALQGQVDIMVTASDATSPLAAPPTVTVVDSASASMTVTYDGESPTGTFHYHVVVLSTTANGAATINASVSDSAGNSESATAKHFNVNKTQIAGTVEMDTFRDTTYAFDRVVVFKATNAGGTVLKTWPAVRVHFVNDPASGRASGSYVLTDVPSGTARLSAKTAWSLRRRLAASFDGAGQATVDFTKAAGGDLLGGDLDDSNTVIILDYSILRAHWNSYDGSADINGDGQVQLLDYSIMKNNWFGAGDPP